MKKYRFIIAMLVFAIIATSIMGCYGNFALTKKVYKFNKTLGNKWINSIAMVVGGPVYSCSVFIDVWILNLIQFWTGTNPLTMGPQDSETKTMLANNKNFEITATQNQFVVKDLSSTNSSNETIVRYDPTLQNWYVVDNNKTLVQTVASK